MSARTELMDMLAPLLPDTWALYPYPAQIDGVETGDVVLLVESYAEHAQPIRGLRAHTLTLALVVPFVSSPDADDALDEQWEELRDVLNDLAGAQLIHWTEATRSTFDATYPSLTIPVTMNTKD